MYIVITNYSSAADDKRSLALHTHTHTETVTIDNILMQNSFEHPVYLTNTAGACSRNLSVSNTQLIFRISGDSMAGNTIESRI